MAVWFGLRKRKKWIQASIPQTRRLHMAAMRPTCKIMQMQVQQRAPPRRCVCESLFLDEHINLVFVFSFLWRWRWRGPKTGIRGWVGGSCRLYKTIPATTTKSKHWRRRRKKTISSSSHSLCHTNLSFFFQQNHILLAFKFNPEIQTCKLSPNY